MKLGAEHGSVWKRTIKPLARDVVVSGVTAAVTALTVAPGGIIHDALFNSKKQFVQTSQLAELPSGPVGSTVDVPGFEWATVENKGGVANGNVVFTKGESCSLEDGGTATVKKHLENGRETAQYATPHDEIVYGAPCPTGTIILAITNN